MLKRNAKYLLFANALGLLMTVRNIVGVGRQRTVKRIADATAIIVASVSSTESISTRQSSTVKLLLELSIAQYQLALMAGPDA